MATGAPAAEPRRGSTTCGAACAGCGITTCCAPLAITLGLMTALSSMTTAAFVLFGQEVLDTKTTEFAVISIVAAVGGLLGGLLAGSLTKRLPSGALFARRDGRVHGRVGRRRVGVVVGRRGDPARRRAVRRRPVERRHGQPAAGDHPRRAARSGQQRVPVLRLGDDPDRRCSAASSSRRPTPSAHARPPCGCRGSSPAPGTSSCSCSTRSPRSPRRGSRRHAARAPSGARVADAATHDAQTAS